MAGFAFRWLSVLFYVKVQPATRAKNRRVIHLSTAKKTAAVPVIKCAVSEDEKQEWQDYCRSSGLSESDALRRTIRREAGKKNAGISSVEGVSDITDTSGGALPESALRSRKITLALSPGAFKKLKDAAAQEGYGSPTARATACLMSVLEKKPVLTKDEISALRDSCRQLAAVGRNLNQLVRVLQRYPDEARKVTPQAVAKIAAETEAHIAKAGALIAKGKGRFSVRRRSVAPKGSV